MQLSSRMLKLLVCPATGGELKYDDNHKALISPGAGLEYPIIDGIPVLVVDKAKNTGWKQVKN